MLHFKCVWNGTFSNLWKACGGALPRKGHVAQLMRGSCKPPGFEKGACNCPGEKFSRVVRERGFGGYAHPLGTQEHCWGMSLCSRPPRFPWSTHHICSWQSACSFPLLKPSTYSRLSSNILLCPFLSLLTSKPAAYWSVISSLKLSLPIPNTSLTPIPRTAIDTSFLPKTAFLKNYKFPQL